MEKNFYNINLDIFIKIPIEKRKSFQSIFSFIKRKFQIKNIRKSQIDSILKKCKGKFFKVVNKCFQKCLLINVKRFPQTFITNITISYNKLFINKTLIELYKYFNLIDDDMENIISRNQCIPEKQDYFRFLCMSTISELYMIYLESKIYKREIDYVKQQEGRRFACLYQFASNNLIFYYQNCKPNKKKKTLKKNENKFVIVRGDKFETLNTKSKNDITKNNKGNNIQ